MTQLAVLQNRAQRAQQVLPDALPPRNSAHLFQRDGVRLSEIALLAFNDGLRRGFIL